jgi:hypothetical protein
VSDEKLSFDISCLKMLISSSQLNTVHTFPSAPYNMTRVVAAIVYAFLLGCAFLNTAWREGALLTEGEASALIGTIFLSLNVIGTAGEWGYTNHIFSCS